MTDLLALKAAARQKIIEATDLLNQHYGLSRSYPTVTFRYLGGTAGRAFQGENHIELNDAILQSEGEKFLNRTPGHEVAHLFAREVYGPIDGRGHGSGWVSVMNALGIPAIRCHDYDVTKIRPGFTYHCPTCRKEFSFSKQRHNNVRRGSHYICRCRAKTRLIFGKAPTNSVNELPAPIALTTRATPPAPVVKTGTPIDRTCPACKAGPGQPCKATYSAPGQDPNRKVGTHKMR